MVNPARNELSPKSIAISLMIITFIMDVAGYFWHGLLGQPSMVNVLYPGFWSDWGLMAYGLLGTMAMAYVFGYVFAWLYNWALKKF